MQRIEGCKRDQSQLLPARVDDYVHAENPVRFIDAFVDGLDLATAGFGRVRPKETGRPPLAFQPLRGRNLGQLRPAMTRPTCYGSTSTATSTGSGPAAGLRPRRIAILR